MKRRLSLIIMLVLCAVCLSACEPPQGTDTMGSATKMMMGHRPTKKKNDDKKSEFHNMHLILSLGFGLTACTIISSQKKYK